MPKPDKGSQDPVPAPFAGKFEAMRYMLQGGRNVRWIWAQGCTLCGSLVWEQTVHAAKCPGRV